MIRFIKGTLAQISEGEIVLELQGMGFAIFIPGSFMQELPSIGEELTVYTYLNVREDAMQLFANLLQADGTAAMSDTETAQTLASVKDAGSISADRRNAVALCMQKGLVQGFSDGTIKPQGTFTRAEFAKLLTTI